MPKAKPEFLTMRVPVGAHARAAKLLKTASPGGWTALGVTHRTDRPTLGALVDEALKQLEAHAIEATREK